MASFSLPQALAQAIQLHQAGRLSQAEGIYRQILLQDPNNAQALHLLGVLAHQVGKNPLAVELISKAIASDPFQAVFRSNLGLALTAAGRVADAVQTLRDAVRINPSLADAWCNLGDALLHHGNIEESIAATRKAIELRDGFPAAWNNLGNVLAAQGELEEAVSAYRTAISHREDFAEAHANLAAVLRDMARLEEAEQQARLSLQIKPDYAIAHVILGDILRQQGRLEDALGEIRSGIALQPASAEAYNALAGALRDGGDLDAAIDASREAIRLNPTSAESFNSLANALKDQARLDEAIDAYRKAVDLAPHAANIHSNLIYTMYFSPKTCDWPTIGAEHGRWRLRHEEPLRSRIQPHTNNRDTDRRLRIGYVSPDFCTHVLSFFNIPLLTHHDRERFEVYCYSNVRREDAITQRFKQSATAWRDIAALSDDQAAAQIRADGIDILVDLAQHMAHNRLPVFARKPAPVQVAWIGYPGSTGLKSIDYRMTDPHLDPPGMFDAYSSEQVIRLPDSFWCYDPFMDEPQPGELPALRTSSTTFGCLNNFCKVNEPVLALWSRVLTGVPDSRLLLLTDPGRHRQMTLDTLAKMGIDPVRVEFLSRRPRPQYLQLYHRIDITLDTLPYNGHTTTMDSLWMGVPVVSRLGATPVGRAGLSILSNVGLADELLARTDDDFVQIATDLARDADRLAQFRQTLRTRMKQSPLMDAPRFARNVEDAYRQMWKQWCSR
jgi:predicted O-linked N-acetylglucosamine transferase (SPINDLY family)